MNTDFQILLWTALSLGFFHTVLGPDHYLPFVVMNKAGKWSNFKTFWVVLLAGVGHVGSSVVIGLIGIFLGYGLEKIVFFESYRGNIAAWVLVAFGLVYMVWGIRKAFRNKPHTHLHFHSSGDSHSHVHNHTSGHFHVHAGLQLDMHPHNGNEPHSHEPSKTKADLTPWIIFTIFAFGPCEPLIPLLMYPAAKSSTASLIVITVAFGSITILTMLSIVFLSILGLKKLAFDKLERYSHALAGGTIMASGLAFVFLGL